MKEKSSKVSKPSINKHDNQGKHTIRRVAISSWHFDLLEGIVNVNMIRDMVWRKAVQYTVSTALAARKLVKKGRNDLDFESDRWTIYEM